MPTLPAAPIAIDVLVLVAHRLELAGFKGTLPLAPEAAETASAALVHGWRIAAAEVGVGVAVAGAGSARALDRFRARSVVLLGSFGAYPAAASLPIGSLLVPTALQLVDLAALQGRAALPDVMPQRALCDANLAAGLARCVPDLLRATLATTVAITTDDELARELGERSSCCGENLEAVAVALVCEQLGVPFAALLACTNEVGSHGRSQWAAEHPHAARATASALLAWLAHGAPGLSRA